ncbi:MAG: hypothetical protein IJ349_07025 [Clostridia bacterium]|nr:hypothetical protein [Clostridia bacterium]
MSKNVSDERTNFKRDIEEKKFFYSKMGFITKTLQNFTTANHTTIQYVPTGT